jgi:hypothetical protein
LALSEYVLPGTEANSDVWRARLRLMETVKEVLPKLLERLSQDVLPVYGKIAELEGLAQLVWGPSPYEALPERSELRLALAKWASEFHIDATWMLDDALRTLQVWWATPERAERLQWNSVRASRGGDVIGEDFEFRHYGWAASQQAWSDYSCQIHREFEGALSGYERHTRALAESGGLIRSRRTYSADNLVWFVLYQFGGYSSGQIADRRARCKVVGENSGIIKGVQAAAKLIAWGPLRAAKNRKRGKFDCH